MKQLYTLIKFGCFLFILQFTTAYAQNYQPITIQSGFNADVIANGIGPAANSTTHDVDGVNFAFIARNFQSTSSSIALTYGLPESGIINSLVATTPDLSYQLANYSGNNCLRFPKLNDSGTLIFSRSFKAYTIYILATSGSGSSKMDVIVNFTDSSTQTFTGIQIDDWYAGLNFAAQGIGRVNRVTDDLEQYYETNPRLYQIPLAIGSSNQNKEIKSISLKKNGGNGVSNIFAVSADIYNPCTPAENISSSAAMDNVSINWTAASSSPNNGYDYYLSMTDTAPTPATTRTGNVSGTTLNLNSLLVGQTYYVWIRSNCGSGVLGDWKKHVFTTGRISALYDKGDIQTSYITSSSLTTAAETLCPGQLSITIPEGYRIKNTTVEYNMTALQGSQYEQRSFLTCKNNNTTEGTIVSGTTTSTKTTNYKRDIAIANGLTGTVNFELKAFRTSRGTGCSTEYNKVDNNSWKITTTLELIPLTVVRSQTDVLCKGSGTGTATVNIKGGSGKYLYIWTPTGGTAATATGLSTGTYKVNITDAATSVSIDETFTINEPPTLSAITNQTDATCSSGGTASVMPSGGVAPYSYLWTPSRDTTANVSNLAPGNHNCRITDANGCTVTKNFVITTTNTLVASTFQTDLLCHNGNTGSAGVIPSGAPGPFTYMWSPSGGNADTAHNLAAGNYSVTITAHNGCSIVKNFIIIQPPAIVVTKTGQTDVTCFGGSNGSLSVAVTGGSSGYTYLWAPSGGTSATATGLSAGIHTLTVTDSNGCTKTENYTITQPAALTPSITKTNVSCNGGSNGSATVSVTGGTGAYTYLWSPSGGTASTASGLSAGNYIVTIKDANLCQTTASVLIDQPDLLTATIAKTDVTCHNTNNGTATVTANGGTGTYTYSWAPSGGTASTASGLAPGTYTAMITDTNGCFITKTVTISEPSQLIAVTSKVDVSCKGGFNGTASIVATGGTGNYKYSWSPSGGTAATATGLSAGNYTVTVTDENSCSVTMPIIINEPTNPISLSTSTAGNVTVSSALLLGSASSDGIDQDKGQCLIETGFVYSLTPNPSITDNKINTGDSLGALNASLTNLKGNTTYYVRTYAINSNRFINYGNEINFTTEQYTLRITASAGHKKVYGTVDPVFDYTVSGLMNGDTNAVLTGNLSRDLGENVGTYAINLGTLTAYADYNIVFENSTFEITKADQVISWNQDLEFGCDTQNSITLNATSDSGLSITYSLPNTEIAEVSGTVLNIKNSGSSTITASQNGDQNHNPAIAIIKPIEVSQNGLITQQWADVLFFDNNSKDFVAWQWYKNGIAVSGATRQYYNENQALNGTYFVIATNKEGKAIKSCPFEAKGVTITKTLKIYPNPVRPSGKFNLDCNFSEAQLNGSVLNIFDINGKIVQTISNVKIQNQITAPTQAAIYILMLTLPNGEQKTINLLVK
ncbi:MULTISPECIES: MBG domain-containing protein [Flavobacterium]|uniref:MBG domain-containing protein n=1 Tax=Flavobacterium TaxID=237 RepID=UPI00118220A5|nr:MULTISPECIES: MBG domain-containing protein [Flavobacterium]MCR4029588.1 T9SS type A sorting domain-containing protein [Flavobacterium panacis]